MFASRRSFIAGAGALGACASAPRFADGAERTRLIDVHHHFRPDLANNPAAILADMDRNGVSVAMGFVGTAAGVGQAARDTARRQNEGGARVVQGNPSRFGLMASLPMEDVDGALAEIAYAYDVLKTDGIGLATSYGDAWLGDPKFEPIWNELNRRNAVVFFHPFDAPCCTQETLTYETTPIIGPWMEWPMNSARNMLSLMSNQTLTRNPNLKLIIAHGGGVMPILVKRLAGFIDQGDDFVGLRGWRPATPGRGLAQMFPQGVEAEFAKFYFELAQAYQPEYIEPLTRMVPQSHLVFGTDFPLFQMHYPTDLFYQAQMSDQLRRAMGHENALALFPRVRANWRA